jgi:hypothetical protein
MVLPPNFNSGINDLVVGYCDAWSARLHLSCDAWPVKLKSKIRRKYKLYWKKNGEAIGSLRISVCIEGTLSLQ